MSEMWDIVDVNGNKTGRTHERGKPMNKDDYHPAVSVWIVNSKGEFLISKRIPTKVAPNMWETTSGSVIAGEDSLLAALREVREELGITLKPENGRMFTKYTYPHSSGDGAAFFTVWVFRQEVLLSDIFLQTDETCDVMWADKQQIKRLIAAGSFINYTYLNGLFEIIK